MKKQGALALILVVLLTLIWWAGFKDNDQKIDISDRTFAIQNISAIHSIKIISKDNPPINLAKKNGSWEINGKYAVRDDAINNLLEVAELARLKYIPGPNAVPKILEKMAVVGLKVQYFNADQELLKSYYVGGATSDERGTHFLMEGASKPYVIEMPTLEGTLRPRFITKENEWRDRTVFKTNPSKIIELSVEYPKEKTSSFRIYKKANKYEVYPFYDLTTQKKTKLRPQLVRDYIENYEGLVAEYIDNDNQKRDSISALVPFSIIRWKEEGKEEQFMRLFPIDAPQASINELSMAKTIERYFADCSSGDFMLVQQRLVGKFLRPYEYFFYR
jgi:hypothetical protein